MQIEVIVDGYSVGVGRDFNPIRANVIDKLLPLLEEDNVGRDFRPGVVLKGVVGSLTAPNNSALCARYCRTDGFALSSVPFDVMNATTPPGRTLSSVLAKK